MNSEFQFEVFHGRLQPHFVRVFAFWQSATNPDRKLSLSGSIRGPECRWAKTLPTTVPFVEKQTVQATITEPCFWTSDLPAWYRVKLELRKGARLLATHEQMLGLRNFAYQNRNLYWSNQRWVLRGAFRESVRDTPLLAWRELATAMLVETPDEELCREASLQGVVLVALVPVSNDLPDVLRRLAKWPAVTVLLIRPPVPDDLQLQKFAPNAYFGTAYPEATWKSGDWSHASLIDVGELGRAVSTDVPLIVSRKLSRPVSLEEARAACDALQQDVVYHADFAGYVV